MVKKLGLDVLKAGKYKIVKIASTPPRLEAKIILDKYNLSYRLICIMMETTHQHGFSCSPPLVKENRDVIFLVGTILPNRLYLKKYLNRMENCLNDLTEFFEYFTCQLDFSNVDVSMFSGIDLENFRSTEILAVRDQHHNGSWEDFIKYLEKKNKLDEIEVLNKCMIFEVKNKKDLSLVGHKLDDTLHNIIQKEFVGDFN